MFGASAGCTRRAVRSASVRVAFQATRSPISGSRPSSSATVKEAEPQVFAGGRTRVWCAGSACSPHHDCNPVILDARVVLAELMMERKYSFSFSRAPFRRGFVSMWRSANVGFGHPCSLCTFFIVSDSGIFFFERVSPRRRTAYPTLARRSVSSFLYKLLCM